MKFISKMEMFHAMEHVANCIFETIEEIADNADYIFGVAGDELRDEYKETHYDFDVGDVFLDAWIEWMKENE